jgi:hypothetical protein
MATTIDNAKGRVRLVDNTALYNRWLDTLAKRTSPQLPDGQPMFPANPDGSFYDITTMLTNIAFLAGRLNTKKVTVAAGAGSGVQVINAAGGGTLANVLVTTAGTAALLFYDHASAASGDVVGTVPANALAGTLFTVNSGQLTNGLVAGRATNTPAVTVTYTTT